jgi:uncharacterized membrane protein SpoIIM required for sporulation
VDLSHFVERGRTGWEKLSRLLDRMESNGFKTLSLDEARHFGRLYRSASSDLIWARSHSANAELVDYLNALVARGYAQTYPGKAPRAAEVWHFYAARFPILFREHIRAFAAAYALFLTGVGVGYVGMKIDPEAASTLMPEQHLRLDPDERIKKEAEGKGASASEQGMFSSFLFTHNIEVAFLVFALGLTAAVGTAVLLFFNGLMLGSLATVYEAKGHALWFWAWILPHGIPEITAICIGGTAGLILGRAIVAPGDRGRGDALRTAAKIAVQLVLGCIPIFIVAGLIEGTISQIHEPRINSWVKVAFALGVGSLLAAYLAAAGRREQQMKAAEKADEVEIDALAATGGTPQVGQVA